MAKVITQETFDDVVKENIIEFSMSVEESRTETVQQFEAQGINLANIIQDLNVNPETGVPLLNEAVEYLRSTELTSAANKEQICGHLAIVVEECKLSVPHRVLAAKLGAYELIVGTLEKETALDKEVLAKLVAAANAIINKQPDVFSSKSLEVAIRLLQSESGDDAVTCDLLRWLQKACILHEMNRQTIMDDGRVVKQFKRLIENNDSEVVKQACALFRFLILDDDIRVEFGKAHEHARTMANEMLPDITKLLFKFNSNQDLISDLFLTIASLTVRNEFCQVVEEAGGLKFIMDAMVEFPDSIKLLREACKLLKALAGNDTVKLHIIQQGAAPLLESCLNRYKDNETFARHALACVTALALREKNNAQALFETGIAETIVQTMKIHAASKVIQRNGAWAIRNMVSRSREQCDAFLTHGAEDVLNAALTDHPSIAHDVKSALRDLGCKVHLNEEWKAHSDIQIQNEEVAA
ncbi:armadillo repeat-containing protein 6 homolog [Culex pipiens pallens]|uniref:armadillo repeat-containing protein 6 homolog n=1 Tax=Culex pipiens pallens TaxID=42434 RepID=UPI001954CECC|nr:armadillo repeat-containing protein 6 homolog [Culex pipiens pallens]XP_039434243.1 armadillo repeat-containing protein 6 homolog [Culex pipiens pallens]XP_039434244.1 armadillo repeat-containing protein 6 homolog [Culex pipiens pallens]